MCAAGSRIYVQESIYDRFVESLTGAAQAIKHGDGFDPNSQQGPLISRVQLQVWTLNTALAVGEHVDDVSSYSEF